MHILHDNTLSADNRDKFSYIACCYGQIVKFYNVEKLCTNRIAEIRQLFPEVSGSQFSIATFYRLLIPQVLPADIDKCIYLDSDMIVNLDIAELWRVELGDKPLAAVTISELGGKTDGDYIIRDGYVKVENYFNSGVLLMNLKTLRTEDKTILDGIKFIGTKPNYKFFDQTILNYCFSERIVKLPSRFNKFVWVARKEKETFAAKKIYHYTYTTLRLGDDPYNRLWMNYFIRTPWFDAQTFGRLYADFQRNYGQLSAGLKNSMIQLSAMMSGKTRAFFALPADIEAIRKIFLVRPDEEIISAENAESVQKLFDAMNASRGQKIFFVMLPKFPFQLLMAAGFVPGRDFVNGLEFVPDARAATFDSHALIKAM